MDDDPWVHLVRWAGPWADDDPDANFKAEIALYAKSDPLTTVSNLAAAVDVPVGAVVRYVLARWASAGSEALLSVGPSIVERMWDACEAAEETDTDEARLTAYETLHQMVGWIRLPLHDDAGY